MTGWEFLGYRRWLVSIRGYPLVRGNGPRPLMDQQYRVISVRAVRR